MLVDIPIPTEAEEAQTLMAYMRAKGYMFTHVKNETGRAMSSGKTRNWRAVWDKKDGVSKGFPDFVIIANGQVHFIELKRSMGARVSDEQREWIESLARTGAKAAICLGADEAIRFLGGTVTDDGRVF